MKNSLKNHRHNYQDSPLPVIKIDFEGNILFANMASFPVLKLWNCNTHGSIPWDIMKSLSLHEQLDIESNNAITFRFQIVPFWEAGFIGFYCNSSSFSQKNQFLKLHNFNFKFKSNMKTNFTFVFILTAAMLTLQYSC